MNAVISIDIKITGRKAECIINDMKVNGMDPELTGNILKILNDNRKRVQIILDRYYGENDITDGNYPQDAAQEQVAEQKALDDQQGQQPAEGGGEQEETDSDITHTE